MTSNIVLQEYLRHFLHKAHRYQTRIMVQFKCLRQEGATVFSKMQDLCACVVRLIFYIRQPLSKQACLKIAASPAQHGTINEQRFAVEFVFWHH